MTGTHEPSGDSSTMNTPLHSSHGGQRCRNATTIIRVLDQNASRLKRTAELAVRYPTRRKLLKLLVTRPSGVTYKYLFKGLSVCEREVRRLVSDLRSDGIVITPGNPALIQFDDESIELAIRELVSFICSDWVKSIARNSSPSTIISTVKSATAKQSEEYLTTIASILRGRPG